MTETFHTVTEVAAILSIGRTSVYALIKDGSLGSVQIGRSRRVTGSQLDAYVASLAGKP